MSSELNKSFGIRSEVRSDGTLRIWLEEAPLPEPAADELVVEMKAAPLHPADISQLLASADLTTGRVSGHGSAKSVEFKIASERMASLRTRLDIPLPVGNEGSGVVVAAGDRGTHLVGKRVALMGGAMVTQRRVVPLRNALPLPDEVSFQQGAASLINPLTALAMLETMREQGHIALVHTAAASSLGQMLNRICIADGIGLVNIVRSGEQAELLEADGARHICNSRSITFTDQLEAQITETGATLAFDAIGGGALADQILSAMERAALKSLSHYDRYGSKVRKQVYFYGGLDPKPSELGRGYGMTWSVGGWLIFDEMERMTEVRLEALRSRIAGELLTAFAIEYAEEIPVMDLMDPTVLQAIAARGTHAKHLVNPTAALE